MFNKGICSLEAISLYILSTASVASVALESVPLALALGIARLTFDIRIVIDDAIKFGFGSARRRFTHYNHIAAHSTHWRMPAIGQGARTRLPNYSVAEQPGRLYKRAPEPVHRVHSINATCKGQNFLLFLKRICEIQVSIQFVKGALNIFIIKAYG